MSAVAVQPEDYQQLALPFQCAACGRGFDSRHGLAVHVGRWCTASEPYSVQAVLDHRGGGSRKCSFLLEWCGYSERTWTPEHLCSCTELVAEYWSSSGRDRLVDRWFPEEHRCEHCARSFKREQDLRSHSTRGCPENRSRVGSRAEKLALVRQQEAVQAGRGRVQMGGQLVQNRFRLKYLGARFTEKNLYRPQLATSS